MARLQDVIGYDVLANRPAASIAGRLYFATDTNRWYRDNGTSWDVADSALVTAGGAPSTAHFLTSQSESSLSNEVNLGALTTGLPKMTVSTGVAAFSRAVEAVDYYAPNYSGQLDTISALSPGNANIL